MPEGSTLREEPLDSNHLETPTRTRPMADTNRDAVILRPVTWPGDQQTRCSETHETETAADDDHHAGDHHELTKTIRFLLAVGPVLTPQKYQRPANRSKTPQPMCSRIAQYAFEQIKRVGSYNEQTTDTFSNGECMWTPWC